MKYECSDSQGTRQCCGCPYLSCHSPMVLFGDIYVCQNCDYEEIM
jgi:hypothetical protein